MKKFYLIILLLSVSYTISAQSIEVFDMSQAVNEKVTPTSPYLLTGKLHDNVFVGAAFGVGFYFGDDDGKGSQGGRAGMAWEISAGKWFTPFIGARLQFAWMQARGHSASRSAYHHGLPDEAGYYEKRFNIDNYRGDLLFNITNLTQGYANDRIWNCIPFLGAGIGRSHGKGASIKEFNMSAGILNLLRITDKIDGTAEIRYMAVNSRFDGIAGKGLDGALTLSFGLQFNFGKKGFRRPIQILD